MLILVKEDIIFWKHYWLDEDATPGRHVGQVYQEKQPIPIDLGMVACFVSKVFSLRTTDIFCWILSCGGFPGHCRTVSSIPGLYTLDVNSIIPQRCDNQKSFQM